MQDKLLRLFLPEQLKALLEKIDGLDVSVGDRSIRQFDGFINMRGLTRYEQWLICRALNKHHRALALSQAIQEVLCMREVAGDFEPLSGLGKLLRDRSEIAIARRR
jgi:hypothetical protein